MFLQKIFTQNALYRLVIKKSKSLVLPGFQGLPLYDVVKFFADQMNKTSLNERAAAISFNFIMAIPAACIFIFTLVPYLPIRKEFIAEILKLTKEISPNQSTYLFVREFLEDFFDRQRGGLLSFVFLLTIFYASNAMIGIIRAFDHSIQEKKLWLFSKRVRAIQLTLLLIILIFSSVILLIGQEQLALLLKKLFHLKKRASLWGWNYFRVILIMLLTYYGIGIIYKFGPSVNKKWSIRTTGGLLATILIVTTTLLFSYWVNHFANFNKLYGSVGTVLIIMNIVFFNSMAIIIGFELNVSITKLKAEAVERNAVNYEL